MLNNGDSLDAAHIIEDGREDAILSAIFADPDGDTLDRLAAFLPPDAFRSPRHSATYATCLRLRADGVPLTPVTVAEYINRNGDCEEHLGQDWFWWLTGLCQTVVTAAPEFYAREILAESRRRRLQALCNDIARDSTTPVDELLARIQATTLDTPRPQALKRYTAGSLIETFPELAAPAVDGLFRRGETCNVVSVSKAGKSWLTYGLLLSFVTRRPWLGKFNTAGGRALLVDNELHAPTLAYRLQMVAGEMGIDPQHYSDALEVCTLRGELRDLYAIAAELNRLPRGEYGLIVLDAWYRFLPPGMDENSNADVMQLYNELDRIAGKLDAAIVCVHHSSKGNQSDKRVTDVGAGAGSQSRAADCHIALREHSEDGCLVLDGVTRSFPPVEPVVLRWQFPLWVVAEELDPAALKREQTRQDKRQSELDAAGAEDIINAIREHGASTRSKLHQHTGISHERLNKLLAMMRKDGRIVSSDVNAGGKATVAWALPDYLAGVSGCPITAIGQSDTSARGCPGGPLKGGPHTPVGAGHTHPARAERSDTPKRRRGADLTPFAITAKPDEESPLLSEDDKE